jgi:crotonobetainyl-CoA:carnitine CoA-transferase CaiB-like acyl-CoA transferase
MPETRREPNGRQQDVTTMTMPDQTAAPLHGIRVLEIAPPSAGSVTRLYAELGADVIKILRPEPSGAPKADNPFDASKRVIPCQYGGDDIAAVIRRLADEADIVVETRLDATIPAFLDTDRLEAIRSANPQLVILSLTPFGEDNAYSGWQSSSSIIDALVGNLARSGIPGCAPLPPPAAITLECAWMQAAWVGLISYFHRLRTGIGDRIDLSIVEAAVQAIDPGFGMGGSALAGKTAIDAPRGRPEGRHLYPLLRCKDGLVRICVLAPRQWQGMFEWMGRPERYASPDFNRLHVRFKSPTLLSDIASFFANKSRAELETEAVTHGVPLAAVLSLEEWINSEQSRARGATARFADSDGCGVEIPNGVVEVDGARAGARGLPAVVGVEAEWLAPERFAPEPEAIAPARPLSGLTVVDFGVIVAGAEQARLLADQGALTIKVENKAFPDGGRQSEAGWIVSPNFAMGHRNKKGLGLDLRQPAGMDLLFALARKADVVMANFKPGTLDSLGAGYDRLAAENPRIVVAESSAYGGSGPWRGRPGYGPLVRASSGLSTMWAYPGGDISDSMTIYPDHVCGRILAISAVSLLIRRMRTDRGGHVDMAQAEAITAQLATQVAAISRGTSLPVWPDAPWGAYPCAGDDEWCVVTVRNDEEWLSLTQVIERSDLEKDRYLRSTEGRIAHRERLNDALSKWTAKRDPDTVMVLLQKAGVPAAKMLRVHEMPSFPFFLARRAFQEVTHPQLPHPLLMENSIGMSERLPEPPVAPAPVPGEHSRWIASELLGLDAETIDRLYADAVLETYAAPA